MLEVRDPADGPGQRCTATSRLIGAHHGRRVRQRGAAGWDVHHPFGGFRDSGSAFKEQGGRGLRFYTRIKMAAVRFAW